MDQAKLDQLRAELVEDREQQLGLLDEHGAGPYSDEVTGLDIDTDSFADSAQATEERSEILGALEISRHRVQAIDQALERMDEGAYGTCVECGEAIAPERLEIRPLSVRCVRCAEAAA